MHDKFSVEIKYKTFVDHYKKIVPHIQSIGKSKVADKNEILNVFSLENWEKLCPGDRKCHTIVECKGCLHNIQWEAIMSLFVQGIPKAFCQLVSKAERFGLKLQAPRINQAKLVAKKIIKDLDNNFQINFKIKLSEIVLSQLSHSEEKKKIKGALEIAMKAIENQKAETSVLRTFGSNVLLAIRNKNHLTECFEMKANAIICTEKNFMDLSFGEKRPHGHTGPSENFLWQEEACISEVNNFPDGTFINYSELSSKFDLKFSDGRSPGNAGECMKNS